MRGASGDDPDGTDDVEDADEPPRQPPDSGTADAARPDAEASSSSTGRSASESDAEHSESVGDDLSNSDSVSSRPSASESAASGSTATQEATDASEIDPAELTVSERSLHPRIRILWILRAVIWALVLGGIVSAATWQWLEIGLGIPAAITGLLLVLFVAHAILRYRAWNYEFREDAIYLERGVLTRVRTVVPFVRIQHVDTARGPIDRAAGLSTLVVYTAGSRGADVTIPGIEAERATDHQRRLKQLAIAAEDDTAV